MKIALDIGHTAHTSAVSEYAVEHALATAIGERLFLALQAHGQHETRLLDYPDMTDNTAEFIQVVADANDWGADLFISLHADYASHASARGAHVCYRSSRGKLLATCLAAHLCPIMPGRADAIKERMDLYVLRCTHAVAVLVELGFITNPDDVACLQSHDEAIAQAIMRGILDYLV